MSYGKEYGLCIKLCEAYYLFNFKQVNPLWILISYLYNKENNKPSIKLCYAIEWDNVCKNDCY